MYNQVTLWQHVSTVNGHLQANREHFKLHQSSTQWDPISFTVGVKMVYGEIPNYD